MPSDVTTTPESRVTYSSGGISNTVRDRVRAVDPNGNRCLLQNVAENCSVEFCHCIPRSDMQNEELVRVRGSQYSFWAEYICSSRVSNGSGTWNSVA